MPPAPPLSKGGGRACEAGGIPAALPLPPFCPAYPCTSFTSFSPRAKDVYKRQLYTGHIGDGKIFVYNVAKVVKVRTGEQDYAALQDVE